MIIQWTNISGKNILKRITIQIINMIEIKAELLTGMKRSCQKVYFTMKHNPKSEICYKVGEIDRCEILMGSFNNILVADKCKPNFIPHKHRIYLYLQYY